MKIIVSLSLFLALAYLPASAQCISGDCLDGHGAYILKDGSRYIGKFEDGMPHGKGTCYYADGSNYSGQWQYRFPNGIGTMTLPDGRQKKGKWEQGIFKDDDGEFTEKAAERFMLAIQSGCVAGNCGNGEGVYAFADGSLYKGHFKDSLIDGFGRYSYVNGDLYIGDFKQNFPDGEGATYKRSGTILNGFWEKGEYVTDPSVDHSVVGMDCTNYDCPNGKGTFFYEEGKFVGTFNELGYPLEGTIYFYNGDTYEGRMKKHCYDGYGTLHRKAFGPVEGYWRECAYLGKQQPQQQEIVAADPRPAQAQEGTEATVEEPPLAESVPQQDHSPTTATPRIWAIIAGVTSCMTMQQLRYPDDDAYRMYAFLKSPEGGALSDDQVKVLVEEDATQANIINSMKEVFWKAGKNDLIIFFFSGHGVKGAFLPTDFDGYEHKLLHKDVADILAKSPARHKLCIADACHSGSLLIAKGYPVAIEDYYEQLSKSEGGTALLMSSTSEETSLESKGLRQGVFSHFLLRGLKGEADFDNDGMVRIGELFRFVGDNVKSYTAFRQTPVLKGEFDPLMPVGILRQAAH
jgi:hypothetical protein